jgi:uncharacterized membrane protein
LPRQESKIKEISRVIITALLLGLVAFLYWCAFNKPTEQTLSLSLTNVASLIVGGVLTFWLRPV